MLLKNKKGWTARHLLGSSTILVKAVFLRRNSSDILTFDELRYKIVSVPKKKINVQSDDMIEDNALVPLGQGLLPDPASKKRKRTATSTPRKTKELVGDLASEHDTLDFSLSSKKNKGASPPISEKRLRRFRQHAPASYLEKLSRATTQRLDNLSETANRRLIQTGQL